MAGRWKVGRNGLPEWEEGVNAPNQIDPPQQQAPQAPVPAFSEVPQDFPTNYLPQAPQDSNFTFPTPGYQPSADPRRETVASWYKQYLGREGSEQEYQHWMNQPGDLGRYQQNISGSPEAQAYRSRPQPQAQPQAQAPQGSGYNEQALRALITAQPLNPQQLAALIQSRPDIASGVTITGSKGDKLRLPDGRVGDVIEAAGAGGTRTYWGFDGGGGAPGQGMTSSYMAQFNDPLTQQYERMLQAQTGLYQTQQQQMQEQAARAQQTRSATEAAVARLTEFLNQRAGQLQQPAYSGQEAEVLRTRALEPIEQDRQAAQQRALQRLSSRGLTPESGISQQLLNDVDAGFDQSRAAAQNQMAYRQIEEERSRQQEAQQLLTLLAQLPDATARGDLDFVNYVTQLINQPAQQGLATSALLADLPVQRTQLGLQTLGLGGSPMSAFGGASALLQNSQQQRYLDQQNQASYLNGLGRTIGYLFGA